MPKSTNSNGNFIKLIFVTLLSMGLTMISSFILAHMLSVADRGGFQLFVTSISYVVTISTGGVGFAIALAMRKKTVFTLAALFFSLFNFCHFSRKFSSLVL